MALVRAHKGQKSTGIFSPRLVAHSTFSLTQFQISKSNLPSSGNQGLYSITVWRHASIRWCETESPWMLNSWWSKVEKWWGFPAVCPITLHLLTSVGPNSHAVRLPRAFTRSLFGGQLSRSLQTGTWGLESTRRRTQGTQVSSETRVLYLQKCMLIYLQ